MSDFATERTKMDKPFPTQDELDQVEKLRARIEGELAQLDAKGEFPNLFLYTYRAKVRDGEDTFDWLLRHVRQQRYAGQTVDYTVRKPGQGGPYDEPVDICPKCGRPGVINGPHVGHKLRIINGFAGDYTDSCYLDRP